MLDKLNLSNAELLALLKAARATAPMQAPATLSPIEPVDRSGPLPLSFAQQRLWFVEQMGTVGTAYHMSTRMRLKGALHREALVRALDRIVARHEALRTVFHAVDGKPVQRIVPVEGSRFHLVEQELSGDGPPEAELRRVMAEEAGARFDLERGPLIRGRLVRRKDDDHMLLITMHHIVSDGWSLGVFTRELGALYDAFRRGEPDPLPPLPVQYADYAVWQRKWVDGEVLKAQAEYWRKTLAGAPELLELPADHVRPARQDFSGGVVGLELGAELTAGLKALAQRHGATLFMTLLAGWAVVLSRLARQDDVVIGSPTAGRGRREIEGLIGFFVNTLAIRVDVSGAPTVAELLGRVKDRALGAQLHQDIPFEQVVELLQPVRSLAHTPVLQVMFTLQSVARGEPGFAGPAPGPVAPAPRAGAEAGPEPKVTAKFDLSLVFSEQGERLAGTAEYAAALFERATVERWLGYLRRVLEAFVADDGQQVNALPLLAEDERRQVVEEWNATDAAFPSDLCIHELFEEQAAHTPNAVAVVHERERVTYAELNARANRLAHRLRALGVGPDTRVAISVDRGVEMMVGLLAIMKAGGAYVPLDPAHPAERLGGMLADSAPVVLLTQGSLAGLFEGTGVRV
ncbi:MAG TPA: condensation domain-containing protein, partial [Longimicrobium sp.]